MASATSVHLLIFTVIAISAISASARPCKTIFFITSSSSTNQQQLLPNPNNNNNSPRLTFFITEIREFRRTTSLPRPMLFDRSSEPNYFAASSTVKASIRERTMDVMSIVGAVLFGVGCGAVTAATMYLFWSLFVPRRFDLCSDSEESDDDEEKDGFMAKDVPPTADEVAAMK